MSDTEFHGLVGRTVAESTPWWPARENQHQAPNIVLVVLDDTGWSDFGCFGSEISTPHMDQLATGGVRFNNFHVTPLCSPTRASLLTGCNHHRVGMRFLADADTGFPNSRGYVRHNVPMLAETLRTAGYGTYLLGKWHLTPLHEITPAGPTHNWPLARGYDRFYGFLDGCTDQISPELYEDNHQVEPPERADYHLTEDLADRAQRYLRDHMTFRPDAPFFLHFATGATHAPLQTPRQYIDRYIDVFRKGWDQTRTDRLTRQIDLGIVPEGTTLTERNPDVAAWDALSDDERDLFAHLQATFAGFLEHTDAQIGRVLHELDRLGVRDNTIVLVLSDNGASREGGPTGDVDANAPYSQLVRGPSEQLAHLSHLGGVMGPAHYPEGWAMAGNTPFRRYKQYTDLGGVRSPLIVSWPGHTESPGRVDDTFAHAVDITPTLLELAGLPPVDDADGTSLAAAIHSPTATTGRRRQGFEMLGHRAIWADGWAAVTEHVPGQDYDEDQWRLYDTRADFSHTTDLAETYPDKLRELTEQWWDGARRNDVMPLDDRRLVDLLYARAPQGLLSRDTITVRPDQGHVPFASAVTGTNRAMVVHAALTDYLAGTDGAVLASGNARSGYTLYVLDGRLRFEHHFLGERTVLRAPQPLPDGTEHVGFVLGRHERSTGAAAAAVMVDGQAVARSVVPRTSGHLSFYGLDVGRDPVSAVSAHYQPPFHFPSTMLSHVTIQFREATDLTDLAGVRLATE